MSDTKPTTTTNGWPCGWPEPKLDEERGRGPVITWESLGKGCYLTPDEAIVIGTRIAELGRNASGDAHLPASCACVARVFVNGSCTRCGGRQ